jgi:hypothetical protein
MGCWLLMVYRLLIGCWLLMSCWLRVLGIEQ